MTDSERDERKELLRKIFGDRPEPDDPEADAGKSNPELRKFTRRLFHRA